MKTVNSSAFYYSILGGIILWISIFLITPVAPTEHVNTDTVLFVFLGYTSLFLGFRLLPNKFILRNKKIKANVEISLRAFYFISFIVLFAFIIRWIDIFCFRKLSFFLTAKENRLLNSSIHNEMNGFFILASLFKSIYFFPFVLCVCSVSKKITKKHLILSILLLLLPSVEAMLLGTRKTFLEILLIIFFTCYLSSSKINFKDILKLFGVAVISLFIFYSILYKREMNSNTSSSFFYKKILSAKYNDLLKPNQDFVDFMLDNDENDFVKSALLILTHLGQYATHGFFEMNHIMNQKDIPMAYGKYTFYPFDKFINKINCNNEFVPINPSPRKIVYLTSFGGFYVDFKWFTIVVFFVIGLIQKVIFIKSNTSPFYLPLIIYFLIINLLLLMINYFRGAGIYPILSGLLIIFLLENLKKTNEKSTNTRLVLCKWWGRKGT